MAGLREQWEAAPLWQRMIIVIIFPTVVIGAIWFYVINPDMEERNRLSSQKRQLNQEITRYKRIMRPQVLENLRKQIEDLRKEEKVRRVELENVVGKIPTRDEIEKVFGEINRIALRRNLVITNIKLSQPRIQSLLLIEKAGRKLIKTLAGQERSQKGRGAKGRGAQQSRGVPVLTVEMYIGLEGKTGDIYAFFRDLHKKGIVSYPRSVSIKPDREKRLVRADVVIDVILQQ